MTELLYVSAGQKPSLIFSYDSDGSPNSWGGSTFMTQQFYGEQKAQMRILIELSLHC